MPFFPPPSHPSLEVQLGAGVTMLGLALLGGASSAVVVDDEFVFFSSSQQQLTVVAEAHDLGSTSLLSPPPPTSNSHPFPGPLFQHILELAEDLLIR
ncbi:hypothetical protein C8R43DRAFT_1141867 [Mycena crocata]|nr:hypothetical protein C8R43DRAFT_1141867 [Mycena crocata]